MLYIFISSFNISFSYDKQCNNHPRVMVHNLAMKTRVNSWPVKDVLSMYDNTVIQLNFIKCTCLTWTYLIYFRFDESKELHIATNCYMKRIESLISFEGKGTFYLLCMYRVNFNDPKPKFPGGISYRMQMWPQLLQTWTNKRIVTLNWLHNAGNWYPIRTLSNRWFNFRINNVGNLNKLVLCFWPAKLLWLTEISHRNRRMEMFMFLRMVVRCLIFG